jgi:hypothetical protein
MTETKKDSKVMTVKTVYARIAILLLAINFGLTGYVLVGMQKSTQLQLESIQGAPVEADKSPSRATAQRGDEAVENN